MNGCFAQRLPTNSASEIQLEYGVAYSVTVGYDVYGNMYDLNGDDATNDGRNFESHIWSAVSPVMSWCLWDYCDPTQPIYVPPALDVEVTIGALSLTATYVAALALLNTV